MDFGIARPVDVSLHTVAGTVPGTVAYMSPEACAGGDVDFRSDLYQFGLCLYEFLCGQAAFPQPDLTSLLEAKASNKYQPIENQIKNIDRRVLPPLRRCLQLDPKERYQSAHSCLVELRTIYDALCPSMPPNQLLLSFLDGKPITSNTGRANLSKIAKPATYAVSALILLLLAAFAVLRYGSTLAQSLRQVVSSISVQQQKPSASAVAPQPAPDTAKAPDTVTAPVAHPQPQKPVRATPATNQKTPVVRVRDTVPAISPEDALFFIEQGKQQFTAGRLNEAFTSFQTALKMPSQQSRQQTVRTCVYWSARCNSALYKQGSIPASNYHASWRSVLNVFPANSPEHIEAAEHLQEAQN
jgi:serine/threonine protein kinase